MALQVWLPLTKDLRNQGVNNVNFTNSGATYSATGGKLGGTYSFNGSSRLEATLPTSINSSVGSLACWVKFDSLPASTAWYNLIQLGAAGGFAASRLSLYYEYGTGINISIDGSSTGQNYIAYTFSTNTWYHIACTNDGTTVKVYINGSQILSKTATKGSYTTAATKIYCGGPTNYYLKGSMNDARYYDHALSPMEVKYIAQGLILHYPLNRNGWGQENLFKASPFSGGARWTSIKDGRGVKIDWTSNAGDTYFYFDLGTGVTLTQGNTYTLSFQCSGMGSSVVSFYWCNLSGNSSMRCQLKNGLNVLTFQMPSNNITRPFFDDIERDTSLSNLQMWDFKLEEGSIATPWCPNSSDALATTMGLNGTTEYDTSGFCNNGTRTGTFTWNSDTPKYAVSTYFANYTQYISSSLGGYTPDAITMSCWVKTSNTSPRGGYHIPFNVHSTDFEMSIAGSSGKTRLGYVVGGSRKVQDVGSNIEDGQWHMMTSTYDGTAIKRYVDGELVNTESATGALSTLTTVGVGAFPGATTYGNTQVYESDCRIYATALSATDVKSLYQNCATIDPDGTIRGQIRS